MAQCKSCGTELEPTEFDQFFTDEANSERLCDNCLAKKKEIAKKVIDFDRKLHPDWYGPTREFEL